MKTKRWIAVLSAVLLAVSLQTVSAQETPAAPAPAAPPAETAPPADAAPQPEAPPAEPAAPAEVDMDKVSYAIGLNMGRSLASQIERDGIAINGDRLVEGFRDAITKADAELTQEEIQQTMQQLVQALPAMQKQAAEKNLAAGQAFMDENAKKEGIKTTESGLQYRVIQEGTGASPTAENRVQVNYRGRLVNGEEFDSSYERGEPAEFPVQGVIPGWSEALKLMKEGAKWEIYVPANLAYGERGQRGIPPNSPLIFEVELLKVLPGEPAQPQGIDLQLPQPGQGQPQGQ